MKKFNSILVLSLLLLISSAVLVDSQTPSVGVEERDAWSFEVTKDNIPEVSYEIADTNVSLNPGDPFFLTVSENPKNGIVKSRIDTNDDVLRINQSLAQLDSFIIYNDIDYWSEVNNTTIDGIEFLIEVSEVDSSMIFFLTPVEGSDVVGYSLVYSYFKSSGVLSEYTLTDINDNQIIVKNTTGNNPASVNSPFNLIIFSALIPFLYFYRKKTITA